MNKPLAFDTVYIYIYIFKVRKRLHPVLFLYLALSLVHAAVFIFLWGKCKVLACGGCIFCVTENIDIDSYPPRLNQSVSKGREVDGLI